jgi:hypothetical protein
LLEAFPHGTRCTASAGAFAASSFYIREDEQHARVLQIWHGFRDAITAADVEEYHAKVHLLRDSQQLTVEPNYDGFEFDVVGANILLPLDERKATLSG